MLHTISIYQAAVLSK